VQLKLLAGGVVLAAVIVGLCDRAIHGAPELVIVWLIGIIGVAIAGTTLLLTLAVRDERLATATFATRRRR